MLALLLTLDILHDHIDVCAGLNDLIQPDDVRVHEQTQDLDLTANCINTGAKVQRGRCHCTSYLPGRECGRM